MAGLTPAEINGLNISPELKAKMHAKYGPPALSPNYAGPSMPAIPPALDPNYQPSPAEMLAAHDAVPPEATDDGVYVEPPPPMSAGEKQAKYLTAKANGLTHEQAVKAIDPPPMPAPKPMPMAQPAPMPMAQPAPTSKPAPSYGYGGGPSHAAGPAPVNDDPYHKNYGKVHDEIIGEKQQAKFMEGNIAHQEKLNAITSKTADEYSAILDGEVAALAGQQEKAEASVKARQSFLARFNSETNDKIEAFAGKEIDPDHYWSTKSTGDKVLSMVAVALSGMANVVDPRRGSKNEAADHIQQQIARDIELQKASIAKQGASIDARKGLYGSYLQQFGSEDAATAMAMESYTRAAKSKVEALMASTSSEETKVRGTALIGAMNHQIDEYKTGRAVAGEKMYASDERARAIAANAEAARLRAEALRPYKDEYDLNKKGIEAKHGDTGGFSKYLPPGTKLPNGTTVNNPFGQHVLVDANNNILDYGKDAGAKGSKAVTVTVPGSLNAAGQWSTKGTAEAHDQQAANKYNEISFAAKKGLELVARARALRAKNHGGSVIDNPEDAAEAAEIERDLLVTKKTAGENSDKDADRILKTIPSILATDPKAAIMGKKPLPDAQLTSLEKSFIGDLERVDNTYLKTPTSQPKPFVKPNP